MLNVLASWAVTPEHAAARHDQAARAPPILTAQPAGRCAFGVSAAGKPVINGEFACFHSGLSGY
jgi:hypothetical protein